MMYYICKVAQYCNRINEFPRECVTGLATRNFLILLARSLKSSNAKSFLNSFRYCPCWQPLFPCRRLSTTGENQSSISRGRKISFGTIERETPSCKYFVKFCILARARSKLIRTIRIILMNTDRKREIRKIRKIVRR